MNWISRPRLIVQGVLVFVVSALCLLPVATMGLGDPFDEGIRVQAGKNVLAGMIPYRDFYHNYGPAHGYWGALLLRLFGEQVMVIRLGAVFFHALAVAFLFGLCRLAGAGARWSLAAAMLFVLPHLSLAQDLYSCDPSLAFLLGAGCMILAGAERPALLFVAGMMVGLAALFRQDFGAYGAVAAAATTWYQGLVASPGSRIRALRPVGILILGIALVDGVAFGLLVLAAGFRPVLENLVLILPGLMGYRRLPFPWASVREVWEGLPATFRHPPIPSRNTLLALANLSVYLSPWITLGVALAVLASPLRRRYRGPAARVAISYLVLAGLLVRTYAFGRCDLVHLYPLYGLCLALLAVLAGAGPVPPFVRSRVGSWAATAAVVAMALATAIVVLGMIQDRRRNYCDAGMARGAKVLKTDLEPRWMVDLVRDLDSDGRSAPIFVGCTRHDRVHANAISVYFFSGRLPGTYYYQIDPGVTTTDPVQRRIIEDLERNGVDTVVLCSQEPRDEPNLSSTAEGSHRLDQYLGEHFETVKRREGYRIARRKAGVQAGQGRNGPAAEAGRGHLEPPPSPAGRLP